MVLVLVVTRWCSRKAERREALADTIQKSPVLRLWVVSLAIACLTLVVGTPQNTTEKHTTDPESEVGLGVGHA